MVPPTGDGGSSTPTDRPILEFLRTRLHATRQVSRASVSSVRWSVPHRAPRHPSTMRSRRSVGPGTTTSNSTIERSTRTTSGSAGGTGTRSRTIHGATSIPHPPPRRPARMHRGQTTIVTSFRAEMAGWPSWCVTIAKSSNQPGYFRAVLGSQSATVAGLSPSTTRRPGHAVSNYPSDTIHHRLTR
jgi:hypothetical protein